MSNYANYSIVTTRAGAVSIQDNVTMEIMHNPVGPWVEANSLYIDQSDFKTRLNDLCLNTVGSAWPPTPGSTSAPAPGSGSTTASFSAGLVVFDVGLGAAANALAALHHARDCFRKINSIAGRRGRHADDSDLPPRLKLISFERDLDLLQFALDHSHHFEHFRGFESAIKSILETGHWEESGISWQLRHGDFQEQISRESSYPDLVFFDPYSPKKNPEMWSLNTFKKIYELGSKATNGCLLLTYSRATSVRVTMLQAGFYVGVGIASGSKDETTQASSNLALLANPLDHSWLKRWQRSGVPYVEGTSEEDKVSIRTFLESHPQLTR
jgi:hypothetical protein